MTIKNTYHNKHTQHFYSTSIEDQPIHADMGDIFHLFTENNDVIDYIFNGETWELYIEKVDIGFDTSNPLPVSLADDQLNISLNAEQINLNTDGIEESLGEPVEIPAQYSMLGRLVSLANILNDLSDNKSLSDIITSITNLEGTSNKTLTDLFNDLETIKNIDFGQGGGKKLSDIYTELTTIADSKTLSNIITAIVNLEGSGNKTITDIINSLSSTLSTQLASGKNLIGATMNHGDLPNILFDTPNSIGTVLGSNETYTQNPVDRPHPTSNDIPQGSVRGWIFADQSGTLYLEESNNSGSGWTTTLTQVVSAGNSYVIKWTELSKRYVRFRYVNGSSAQGTFILFQYFKGVDKTPVMSNDGDLVTIGTKNDTAVIDPTASSTLMAGIKGLLKQLQGTGTGNLPISNANLDIALSNLRDSIIGINDNSLTDILTQLTTMSNTKTLADIVTALSNVSIIGSTLPTGASTSEKQDSIITSINNLKTEIDLIKNTDGIKKITDSLPVGNNVIGKVLNDNLDIALTSLRDSIIKTGVTSNTLADIVSQIITMAGSKTLSDIVTALSNVTVISNANPSNIDITISSLRDSLKGINDKTLSDIITQLATIADSKTLTDIVNKLSNVTVTSNANPSNLDIALSALLNGITKTGETSKTLADIVTALSSVTISSSALPANASTEAKQDLLLAKDFATQSTLSAILAKIISAPSTEAKQDTIISHIDGIETALTNINTVSGIKKIVDPLPAGDNNIGNVDVVTSALPTGASTSANQSTIITHVDGIEAKLDTTNTNLSDIKTLTGEVSATPTANTELGRLKSIEDKLDSLSTSITSIKTTDGIRKITDGITINTISAGDNNIGNVDIVTLPTLPPGINNIGDVDVVSSALPLGASTEATLALILAKLISSPSTEAKQDTMIGHVDGIETALTTLNGKDFATQTTLASILAKIITSPATEAKQDTLIAKDFATQTTLAAILAKIIESPATEAKLETVRALLAGTISTQIVNRTTTKTVTISSGQSLSTEVDLEGYQLCAIEMPSAWDAAALTFQGSSTSGGTYKDIKANGLEVTEPGSNLTATAGVINAIDVNAMALAPIRYLKIRSGTSGSAVNQTANRTLTLILKV